jgi:hypothetical protein
VYFYSQEDFPLIRIGLSFRFVVCAALLSMVAALAQQPAATLTGPIPSAIPAAKKIFVSNAGSDSGLFPSPFSGDLSRGYTQIYAALMATGQFESMADPADADLVLELKLTAPSGPAFSSTVNKENGAADPLPMFRLVIYDRKSHYVLWTLTQSVGYAVGQKNHDHNFDVAILVLLDKFQQLAGKPITPIPIS